MDNYTEWTALDGQLHRMDGFGWTTTQNGQLWMDNYTEWTALDGQLNRMDSFE